MARLATGEPRSGPDAAAETLAFRRRHHTPTQPDDPTRAPIGYDLMTSLPENWIPFIPVHVPGDNHSVQLRRAGGGESSRGEDGRGNTES